MIELKFVEYDLLFRMQVEDGVYPPNHHLTIYRAVCFGQLHLSFDNQEDMFVFHLLIIINILMPGQMANIL